jgi:hypothetical protein
MIGEVKKHNPIGFLIICTMIIMVSCSTSSGSTDLVPLVTDIPIEEVTDADSPGVEETTLNDSTGDMEQDQIVPKPTEAQEESFTPTEALIEKPTIAPSDQKTGLTSTDPSTVQLASGEIQFVELFAYW